MNTPNTVTLRTTNGRPIAFTDQNDDSPNPDACPVKSVYFRALVAIDAGGFAKLDSADDTARDWADADWPTVPMLPPGWVETEIEDRARFDGLVYYMIRACYPSEVE